MQAFDFWVFFTMLGEPEFWGVIAAALFVFYLATRRFSTKDERRVYKNILFFFSIAVIATLVIVQGMKYSFNEERPCIPCSEMNADACNPYCPDSPSFPSGHAAATFAGFTSLFLILEKRKIFLPLFVIPALTAISRVALNVHYWHDIVAGSLIGILVPVAMHHFMKKKWLF